MRQGRLLLLSYCARGNGLLPVVHATELNDYIEPQVFQQAGQQFGPFSFTGTQLPIQQFETPRQSVKFG